MSNNYGAESIKTLDFIEHIRRYPGMYIGSKDLNGLHHCIKEVISNSIDEYLNGNGNTIYVEINTKDKSIIVSDNARGIPHGEHSEGVSTLQACFGVAQTGGKYVNEGGEGGYNTSGGQHGIGLKAVNALSKKLIATSYRDGIAETVVFEYGKFKETYSCDTESLGLEVKFYPDDKVFETINVDIDKLREMIREFSFLCKGLTFKYTVDGKEESFCSKNGLKDYLEYINKNKTSLIEPIYLQGKDGNFQLEVAIEYNDSYGSIYKLYTNNIPQIKGTHLTGFKTAWTSSLNQWARENNILKEKDSNLTGSDYEEGLTLILNFKMVDAVFKGQNKEELSSSEGRTYVQKIISEQAKNYFNTHKKDIKLIVEKAINARKASEAARKARDAARGQKEKKRKKVTNPDKLKDAEKLGQDSILLVVEGNSAASSMAVARDTEHYGILGLRGRR